MIENSLLKRKRPIKSDQIWAYIFVMPQMIGVAVFIVFPVLFSLVLSFCDWNLVKMPQIVGLTNFQKAYGNPIFWEVFRNTGYYALLYVPGVGIVSLCLALMLNRPFRGVSIVRTIFYLPHLTCTVAVCMVWSFMYQSNGLLNTILGAFGISAVKWLSTAKWAMPSLVIVNIWSNMGHHMLLYLAGLKGINPTYYEAARIDGASHFQCFVHVTLPLLTPTIFFTLCTCLINSFQVFTSVYMMTGGGPGRSTQTVVYKIYMLAFSDLQFGRASVWAWSLFAVIMLITLIQFRMQKHWVNYDV